MKRCRMGLVAYVGVFATAGCHVYLENDDRGSLEISKSDKRKQSLYFPETMLDEIQKEAIRLQRSLSWVVQRAWKHARKEIRQIPGSNEPQG